MTDREFAAFLNRLGSDAMSVQATGQRELNRQSREFWVEQVLRHAPELQEAGHRRFVWRRAWGRSLVGAAVGLGVSLLALPFVGKTIAIYLQLLIGAVLPMYLSSEFKRSRLLVDDQTRRGWRRLLAVLDTSDLLPFWSVWRAIFRAGTNPCPTNRGGSL